MTRVTSTEATPTGVSPDFRGVRRTTYKGTSSCLFAAVLHVMVECAPALGFERIALEASYAGDDLRTFEVRVVDREKGC